MYKENSLAEEYMFGRHAKKHVAILSGAMALMVFACVASTNNSYAINSETACSQVPLSEAEYCIDIDNSFNGRAIRNTVVDSSSDRVYATIDAGSQTSNIKPFGLVGDAADSPTNYYYATNELPAEDNLSLVFSNISIGTFIYTPSGALSSVALALVDNEGYALTVYNCAIVGQRFGLWSDTNYLSCTLPPSEDGSPTIPRRGAILRMYYTSQLPEMRSYVEPEPDPEPEEPTDDEAQDDGTDKDIENVDTADSAAKYIVLLALSAAGAVGLASILARVKRG